MPGILPGSKKTSEADFCPTDVREFSARWEEGVVPVIAPVIVPEVAGFREIVAALYNTALLQNPDVFSVATPPSVRPIPANATAGVEVYKNSGSDLPVLVRVQAEMDTTGGTASFLSLGRTAADATALRGASHDYRVGPRVSLLLPPNTSCYAFATSPSGGDTVNLVITVVPLYGRAVAYTKG